MDKLVNQIWDIIVVGTGIGGATAGYSLAKSGKKVLFCEKGFSFINSPNAILGDFPESILSTPLQKISLQHSGRWSDLIIDQSNSKSKQLLPLMGVGTGGSSALFGMIFERPLEHEFLSKQNNKSSNDSSWPINYSDLDPYMNLAEALYRVQPSRPLTSTSQELFNFFESKKLTPYNLRLACDFMVECETCQGYLCKRSCKNDSVKICLRPAIEFYGASLLSQCRVIRLEASATAIKTVVCEKDGKQIQLRAKRVILAAGALETPQILFRSANDFWPTGLANKSGMVGKNLMRHYIDLYFIFTKKRPEKSGFSKQIGLREQGVNLQSFGKMPPGKVIIAELAENIETHFGKLLSFIFGLFSPLIRLFLDIVFSRVTVLASTLEDLPYSENQVCPISGINTESKITIKYKIHPDEFKRIHEQRLKIKKILHPYFYLRSLQAENNLRLAHVCGTCRFGLDPELSVIDKNNRSHEIHNLYIVDSSFFPTSTGSNPALLIAANALRVASLINDEEFCR
jgi:choline dehydrogenase-like flavoprotein